MQMVKRTLLFLLALWLGLLFFAPKQRLYYLLEHRLEREQVVLSGESLHPGLIGLGISRPTVYVQGLEAARADRARFWSLGVLSELEIDRIRPGKLVARYLPGRIDELRVRHRIWDPFDLKIEAKGSFGTAEGDADLKKRTIRLRIVKEGNLTALQPYLRKDAKGWYYEQRF